MTAITLCGIVHANGNGGFSAHIAYPGAEGTGGDRAAAMRNAVQRFNLLYEQPAREGKLPEPSECVPPVALAAKQRVAIADRQRWVYEGVQSISVSGHTIELVFYRPGSAEQWVSHRNNI